MPGALSEQIHAIPNPLKPALDSFRPAAVAGPQVVRIKAPLVHEQLSSFELVRRWNQMRMPASSLHRVPNEAISHHEKAQSRPIKPYPEINLLKAHKVALIKKAHLFKGRFPEEHHHGYPKSAILAAIPSGKTERALEQLFFIELLFVIMGSDHCRAQGFDCANEGSVPARHVPGVIVQGRDKVSGRNFVPLVAGASETAALLVGEDVEFPAMFFKPGLKAFQHLRGGIGRMVVDDDQVSRDLGVIQERIQAPLRPMHLIEYRNDYRDFYGLSSRYGLNLLQTARNLEWDLGG